MEDISLTLFKQLSVREIEEQIVGSEIEETDLFCKIFRIQRRVQKLRATLDKARTMQVKE